MESGERSYTSQEDGIGRSGGGAVGPAAKRKKKVVVRWIEAESAGAEEMPGGYETGAERQEKAAAESMSLTTETSQGICAGIQEAGSP